MAKPWNPHQTGKGSVTRWPGHNYANEIYAPNHTQLTVKVNGVEVKDWRDAYTKEGYVNVMQRDGGGEIALVDGQPQVYRKEGQVSVEGMVKGCTGCALNRARRQKRWW